MANIAVVISAQGIFMADTREIRRLTIQFGQYSDQHIQIAFPVLLANITGWLNPVDLVDCLVGLQRGQLVKHGSGDGARADKIVQPISRHAANQLC